MYVTSLTHLGRDKMDPNYLKTFSNAIPWKKIYEFNYDCIEFYSQWSNQQYSSIGSEMDWRRPGDKPLSKPTAVNLLTLICVAQPQWIKKNETFWDAFY